MEFANALSKYLQEGKKNLSLLKDSVLDFIRILAPFAPHFSEEQWQNLGMSYSIFNEKWPEFNPDALVKKEVEIAVQINGRIRAKLNIPTDLNEKGIEKLSLSNQNIKSLLKGKDIKKVIVVKGRLVNIVAK
jgi:leucyl-tRNA synthetase